MPLSTQLTRLAQNVGALTAVTNAIFEALRAKGVNYAHPKECELVMLPMFSWQTYSTIGWLTDTLPSRFSEYRRAVS